nr:DUF2194 domain-containing protein [uncultured Dorea sp.]
MVSRRNFFAITIVMGIIFFLFQFSNIAKERWNHYEENSYVTKKEDLPTNRTAYQARQNTEAAESIVYVGRNSSKTCVEVAANWASYMKKGITTYTSFRNYDQAIAAKKIRQPKLMLIESADINWKDKSEIQKMQKYVDTGINLVFSRMPDSTLVKENESIRQLLGIYSVKKDQTTVKGIQLYEGFLLGGNTFYEATTKEEKKNQDFELEFPWYKLETGTKSYMRGIPKNPKVESEDYPPVIWSKSFAKANVFVINGDFMEDSTGLGILTGILCETNEYTIYPVVNAQNLVLANYPGMAEENDKKMQEVYSQSLRGVFRDIVWPSISSVYEKNNLGLTCMLAPQFDYEDKNEPKDKELEYYLRLINEENGEAGLSGYQVSDIKIKEKLDADNKYIQKQVPGYSFASFYQGNLSEKELADALNESMLKSVRTVVEDSEKDSDVIGYQSRYITKQKSVISGFKHTYRDDFRMKSVESALGYTSVLADMSKVAYSESEDDSWEKLSEKFASYTSSYWKAFEDFDKTTTAETDFRIRRFLALDYTQEKKDDTITLDVSNVGDTTSWFILRTHDRKIDKVTGGSYKKIEDDAWLIQADKSHVTIKLKEENLYYH